MENNAMSQGRKVCKIQIAVSIFPFGIFLVEFGTCFTHFLMTTTKLFDREQRSKVLKEALLFLFFLLAWNQIQKMFL